MNVIVIDKRHMIKKPTITGTYDKGVFTYVVNDTPVLKSIPLIGKFFKGTKKTIDINGDLSIKSIKGIEEVYVLYNAKTQSYEQINMVNALDSTSNKNANLRAIFDEYESTIATADSILAKPFSNLQDIINIALIILLISAIATGIYNTQTLKNANAPIAAQAKNVSASLKAITAYVQVDINQTQQLDNYFKSGSTTTSVNTNLPSAP